MSLTSIEIVDISLMIVFVILVTFFIHKNRKSIDKQGLMYLYKTKVGLKLINYVAKKYEKILRPMQYLVISIGYLLMASMIYLIVKTAYIYIKYPTITEVFKAPPIMPIFPYFTKFFGLSSIFPDFQFIPFFLAIAIVLIVHEFSHGVFARLNKIRIKSTGLALFLVFPGAFVEQDDRDMNKASKFKQLSVLAAGVFANVITTIIFLGIFWLFFLVAFYPSGVIINDYSKEVLNVSQISIDNSLSLNYLDSSLKEEGLIKIISNNNSYYASEERFKVAKENNIQFIEVFTSSPAFTNQILSKEKKTVIYQIDNIPIKSMEELSIILSKHSPRDSVNLKIFHGKDEKSFNVVLAEHPLNNTKAFLGIGIYSTQPRGVIGFFMNLSPKIDNPITNTHYESYLKEAGNYIFYLFWWIVVINILVALTNMLPAGPLDGGRFFMLSIAGITSEKAGMKSFKIATWFILAILAIMMARWVFSIFF